MTRCHTQYKIFRTTLNFPVLMFLYIIPGFATEDPDSLSITRDYLKEGKFRSAYKTIRLYSLAHPDDFNTTWLFAYTSYFAKHYRESDMLYRKAMKEDPENYYLRLDYARMLVNIGSYDRAKPLLQSYLSYDSLDGTALITRSRLDYYEANYNDAITRLNKIPESSDESGNAGVLKQEINLAKAPWISARLSYATDDQPLQGFFPEITAGWFLHPLADVDLDIQVPVFQKGNNTFTGFWGEAGNKIFFAKPRIRLDVHLGILKFPKKRSITWTGDLSLRKTFLRNLDLKILLERSPYFSTISSIDSNIIENQLSLSVGWNDINSWNGTVAAEVKNYPFDQNNVISIYGWVFAPPLKFAALELRFGLGYNYSTSQKNNFVAEKSLAEILTNYDPVLPISGIYNPYFTPNDQNIASVLFAAAIHPARIFDINISANLGVYSFAMVPYLYLDKNGSGNIYISWGFSRETYFPACVNASFVLKLASNLRLQADYEFSSTYYFIRHYVGLGLKANLIHGGKN